MWDHSKGRRSVSATWERVCVCATWQLLHRRLFVTHSLIWTSECVRWLCCACTFVPITADIYSWTEVFEIISHDCSLSAGDVTCGWWQTQTGTFRPTWCVGWINVSTAGWCWGQFFQKHTDSADKETLCMFVCLFTFAAMMPASLGNEALISMSLPG